MGVPQLPVFMLNTLFLIPLVLSARGMDLIDVVTATIGATVWIDIYNMKPTDPVRGGAFQSSNSRDFLALRDSTQRSPDTLELARPGPDIQCSDVYAGAAIPYVCCRLRCNALLLGTRSNDVYLNQILLML